MLRSIRPRRFAAPIVRRSSVLRGVLPTAVALPLLGGCVFVPPGTSSGELAAVADGPPLVLSAARGEGGDEAWQGATRDADLVHVVVDVTLDLEAKQIHGEVKSRFQALRPDTREIGLHAAGIDVREVLDADGRVLAFKRRGSALRVALEEPVVPGDITEVVVRFAANPTRGFESSLLAGDTFAPQAFGAGEPHGLRHWLPMWDAPGDLTTVHTVVRVRDGLSAIANGVLVGVEESPGGARGERTYTWRQQVKIPVRSIALAAARFETYSSPAEGTELFFHLPPGTDEESAQRTFGESAALLAFFERRLGHAFPFPRYDQAALRDLPRRTLGGASLTLIDDEELVSVADELDDLRERPRRIVARGLARKWFGAWIAPLQDQHLWLLDGLAMQLELDYESRVRGEPEVALEWEDMRDRVARRAEASLDAEEGPTREDRAERSGWALRVLRTRLGEEAFWTLVGRMVDVDAESDRSRVVTVEDFRRLALELLGVDVGPELAQWSGRRTVPVLEVRFQRRSVQGVGESLGVVVRQTQPGPAFRLDVPVVVHFEDGSTVEETLSVDERDEILIVPITERVLDVSVDPGGLLLAAFDVEKDDESWLAQASLGRSSVERARALPELERLAETDERARQALIQILLQSPEPSLRERCTRAMRFSGPACSVALQRSAADDPSPIVRRAALHALLQLYAQGMWAPSTEEVERLLTLRQQESSPGVLEKLDDLFATIPQVE